MTRYFAFGYAESGVSSRRGPLVQYGFDDWREALDAAVDELENHLPELAKEVGGMYDGPAHNWSREGGDGFTYFIEEVTQEQFRRIEGLDPVSEVEREWELEY